MRVKLLVGLVVLVGMMADVSLSTAKDDLPVKGIHFTAPSRDALDLCVRFIKDALPKEGVNTLVLEFNYNFAYTSHPELASRNALTKDDVQVLLAACRDAKVKLIPMFNCLGHQSWAKHTDKLLTAYPEFDETPNKYPNNEDIYCRSYCPNHPEVHKIIFALIDELVDACESDLFHIGMDEVFIIGDDDCHRCGGKSKAKLFAEEVKRLSEHLHYKGITTWMWGDRFIDGKTTGIGEWEAATNETQDAIDMIPKNIVISDWHYDYLAPTAPYFALKGFNVMSCPWRKIDVALGQLEMIRMVRQQSNATLKNRMLGVLHTTWCGMVPFIKEYYGELEHENKPAKETVHCFKELFQAVRAYE